MRWKIFLVACINFFLIAFPGNIIGCGPEADPYDYYTSFFDNDLSAAKGFRPFYYTGYTFLYDDKEPANPSEVIAAEWATYGSITPVKDVAKFINKFNRKDINTLYFHIEKNQPLTIPDSVKNNAMTAYFIKSRDLEALGYVLYAKQVEPYVGGNAEEWEPIKRDSVKMGMLAKNGIQLYKAAKTDLFRLKYGYQVLRLYHYSHNYPAVISFYDEVQNNPTQSILQQLCLSLKAGALFHLKKKEEAAWLFSKAFASTPVKRVSNYISFNWTIDSNFNKEKYLSWCRSNSEKANMLALFALGSPHNDIQTLKDIYLLDPASPQLEILTIREVNKLEEKYLAPSLYREQQDKKIYYSWTYEGEDSIYNESRKEADQLHELLHKISQNSGVKDPGLFEVAAAYIAYMIKDYRAARKYLSLADKMSLSQKIRDQWAMTNLLVTINEKEKIDTAFEEELLPSIQWLEAKAKKNDDWKKFYRNLMTEVIARKYDKQGDIYKEALSIGASDWIYSNKYNGGGAAIQFLRNNLSIKDVQQLYSLLQKTQSGKFEQYLISHNSIRKSDVIDFSGTAYLREYDFVNAIEWLKKSPGNKNTINTNPFIDLTYDREERLASEAKFSTTKTAFAQEMLRLQKATESDKVNAGKYYYKMATGFYNITFYGHAWQLVQYYRTGSDGYFIPKDANAFQKEYYGCYTAEKYFQKALQASTDKNFKARCLFMMAKCSQKQVRRPQYEDFGDKYDAYEAADKAYWPKFMNNKYFPELVKNYSTTSFYKQAFSTCSYLRDFIKKK